MAYYIAEGVHKNVDNYAEKRQVIHRLHVYLSFLLPPSKEDGQKENHCADDDSDVVLAEEGLRAAFLHLCAECQSDEHDDEEIRDLPEH